MAMTATQWMVEPIRKYATFTGRARRSEYWWFFLLNILLAVVLGIVDGMLFGSMKAGMGGIGPLGGLMTLALLIPGIAVAFRRIHDRDKSAWWLLIGLIPIVGGIILLVWFCQRGTVGDNQFGPDPITEGS